MNRRRRSIVLIGMMGTGKSSVGRCLQQRTGLPCFETDEIVESRFGIPISEIFSKYGEGRFREAEMQALYELTPNEPAIIVTGGGIVLREENTDLLKRFGTVVWLDADEETLLKRVSRTSNRPLLRGKNPRKAFAEILHARLPRYAKTADIQIDTSVLTSEEVAVAILTKLARYYRQPVGSTIPATER
jgi:shikimate kinase